MDVKGESEVGRRAASDEAVSPFLTLLRAGDQALRTELARSSATRHSTTKGSAREHALRPVARQLFPRRFEVTSGEVMNAADERSCAQDLIVYDPNVVAGWQIDEANAIVPAEAVIGTIEVKTGAARRDVYLATANLASVKSVFGHRPRSGLAGDLVIDATDDRPLGIAIFYNQGRSWNGFVDDAVEALGETETDLRPDILVIPGVGAVTWPPDDTGKPLRGRKGGDEVLVMGGADTMLTLAYLISSHVRTWVPPQLNVWEYAQGQPSGMDLTLNRRRLSSP